MGKNKEFLWSCSKILASLLLGFLLVYLGWVYYLFYNDVRDTKDSIIRFTFENGPLKLPIASNDYVSIWGAFGDFVGGTLNPVVGFLSVILLFSTWKVTKETLETTKKELAQSTKAFSETAQAQREIQRTQSIQQFDTIFFSMISNLNNVYAELIKKSNGENESELEKYYRKCFSENEYTLLERRLFVDESHGLRKYFIILYQILKNIRGSFHSSDEFTEIEKNDLTRLYANMLRSNLDNKILQLLLLNIYKRFDKYSELIRGFRIFEHMDFRRISDKSNYWNFVLLQIAVEQGQQYFYSSDWYDELKENKLLRNIFNWSGDFYTTNLFSIKYLEYFVGKKINIFFDGTKVIVNIHYDSFNRNKVKIGFKQGSLNLSSEIVIYRDKFLLKKADLYYQLIIDRKNLKILTSENKLSNFSPIDGRKISIE
jgi:hypothetical protein